MTKSIAIFSLFAFIVGGCNLDISDLSESSQPCSGDPNCRFNSPSFPEKIDVLVVIDNSATMRAKQFEIAWAMWEFTEVMQEKHGSDYHLAVITTGMESYGCPRCNDNITSSCVNDTGETGRFQDRLGKITSFGIRPHYVFDADSSCRVITSQNRNCFFDAWQQKGTILPGTNGCAYERGLAPVKLALEEFNQNYNEGFLRDDAVLAVVVFSDEDDCGQVGDVSEEVRGAMANICYFAAKGVGPDGETVHPNDPDQRAYRLTPVDEYYDFLLGLKGGRVDLVKFAAVVGVTDVSDPASTKIDFKWSEPHNMWQVAPACSLPGVSGDAGTALPGTRYIQLADKFGIGVHGFVETICQVDFSDTIIRLGDFLSGR